VPRTEREQTRRPTSAMLVVSEIPWVERVERESCQLAWKGKEGKEGKEGGGKWEQEGKGWKSFWCQKKKKKKSIARKSIARKKKRVRSFAHETTSKELPKNSHSPPPAFHDSH